MIEKCFAMVRFVAMLTRANRRKWQNPCGSQDMSKMLKEVC